MTRSGEVAGFCVGAGQNPNGVGAVGCGDAGVGDVGGVDRDGVRGAFAVLVEAAHGGQGKPVTVVAGQWNADHAGGIPDGEGEEFGSRQFRGEDEIPLVLSIFVVDRDDRLAGWPAAICSTANSMASKPTGCLPAAMPRGFTVLLSCRLAGPVTFSLRRCLLHGLPAGRPKMGKHCLPVATGSARLAAKSSAHRWPRNCPIRLLDHR